MAHTTARSQSVARFLRAALLFVFAAATILPFCTSFFLCAMPCCHRPPSPQSAVQAPMPECPGSADEGCASTMGATTERSPAVPSVPTTAAARLAVVTIATLAPIVVTAPVSSASETFPASTALHVLNSVFRI